MVVRPDTAFPANYQPDGYIAADVSFATLACLAGVAVTIGLMNMRREHLLSSLWAALISGAIGSALMWAVGSRLGSVDIAGLSATIDDNVVVDAPLEIMMPAILLIWSATAALVVTVVAFSDWLQEVRASQREQ